MDFATWQRVQAQAERAAAHNRHASEMADIVSPTSGDPAVEGEALGQADALRMHMQRKHEKEMLDGPDFLETEWQRPSLEEVRPPLPLLRACVSFCVCV